MRVLLLNPYLPPPMGGIEKEVLAVASELVRLGHDVQVLTTTARFPDGEGVTTWPLPEGVEVRRCRGHLRSTLRGFAPARAPLLVPGLAGAALGHRPEVVLVFNLGWGPALRPVLRALAPRATIVYRTYYHPPGGRLENAKRRYLLGTVRLAHAAAVATAIERDQVRPFLAEPFPIEVVPPGVELRARQPERVEEMGRQLDLAGKVAVAHVGRWSRFKGTIDLLRALPEVRRRSGRDVVLVLAGSDASAGEVERTVAELGLGSSVRRAGEVPEADLHALLEACQTFAMPSLYEAYGIVYLEAQAAGLACLGSDVGCAREAMGGIGILTSPGDGLEGLVSALLRLVGDDDLRKKLGEEGRARVKSFTWRHTALGLLGVAERAERAARVKR